jgi:hypothetical protein
MAATGDHSNAWRLMKGKCGFIIELRTLPLRKGAEKTTDRLIKLDFFAE